MRLAVLSMALLFSSSAALGAPKADDSLAHDWRQETRDGEVRFTSNHPAPPPFSETGEPEATMAMDASGNPDKLPLSAILKNEIADIRDGIELGEYVEQDSHKADKGIVSYIEKIDGHPVAFIKYRAIGVKKSPRVQPRSVSHAIMVKDDMIYYVHLIILYAGHQDEVREDQMRLIKAILRH